MKSDYFRGMKNTLVFSLAVLLIGSLNAQDIRPYQLFNKQSKKVTFDKMVKELSSKEVVLFGEYHDDPIAHWLQLELTRALYHRDSSMVLGAEMFERDTQNFLDVYLADSINHKQFMDTVHSIWSNYKTDYAPLVNFAKEKGLPFIATNVPRYLASAVYKGGFEVLDTLSEREKGYLPELPIPYDPELPGYQAMLEMGGGHASPTMPMAQAVKDATMGWYIVQNLPVDGIFVHYNGAYHSNNFEGINWYIQQYNPEVSIGTIATVRQEDVMKLLPENEGIADFILVVDEDMTRTY